MNAEPFELKKSIRLCVSNESMQDHQAAVRWQLRDASGQVKEAHEEEVCVKALSSEWLEKVPLQHAQTRRDYVSYELWENGRSYPREACCSARPSTLRLRTRI